MKKKMKRFTCGALALSLVVGTLVGPSIANAKKAVKLNKKSLTLYEGETFQLKVKNTKAKVKWSSSNKAKVTVNKNGLVKAKKKGIAMITAKVAKKKLKCKVTVRKDNLLADTYLLINESPSPTAIPPNQPTSSPSPTVKPTIEPTAESTETPSPTAIPSTKPVTTPSPTAKPTVVPTAIPSTKPVTDSVLDIDPITDSAIEVGPITDSATNSNTTIDSNIPTDIETDSELENDVLDISTDYYESTYFAYINGRITDASLVRDFTDTEWMKEYLRGCAIYRFINSETPNLDIVVHINLEDASDISIKSVIYDGEEIETGTILLPETITLHFADGTASEKTVTIETEEIVNLFTSNEINEDISPISKIPDNFGLSKIGSYTLATKSDVMFTKLEKTDFTQNKRLTEVKKIS